MMRWWKKVSTKKPWWVIGISAILIIGMGWYALGLFDDLSAGEAFMAEGTEAAKTEQAVEEAFGVAPTTEIILFERQDPSLGEASSEAYQAEVARLLEPLTPQVESITTYASRPSSAFISRDKTKTYAAIVGQGSSKEIYQTLSLFVDKADQSKLKLSLGGMGATIEQTTQKVAEDLTRTEIVTLPVLLILLVLFFGSVVAASVPLGISIVTIIGAFALARLIANFTTIDSYAINVITILGIGLSIDYALLSVNRFREELSKGSVEKAVKTVIGTSGRTIFFSGITVIACLLALLVFPMEFLRSIAIGGASAIAIAMLFTVIVLPSILQVVGKRIDGWKIPLLKKRRGDSVFWKKVAHVTTTRPLASFAAGIAVIALTFIPLSQLQLAGGMDYKWTARESTSQYVGQQLHQHFTTSSPSVSVLMTLPHTTTLAGQISASCDMTTRLQAVKGVDAVISPTPVSEDLNCSTLQHMISADALPPELSMVVDSNMRKGFTKIDVVLKDKSGTVDADNALKDIRAIQPTWGTKLVGGDAAHIYDTNQAYKEHIPVAFGIVVVTMIALLSLQLASLIIPIQSIIINLTSLAISFAVLVGIFNLGWIDRLTGWGTVDGFVMTPLILITTIAFGLAMDYSVFLYSRMRETYDHTSSPKKAITEGIVKTGPIITAAAVMVFVVVIAFSTSGVLIMQMIGIGLGIAVLVDAFFVRLILVPSLMTLVGKASWYAPKWLKRISLDHEK